MVLERDGFSCIKCGSNFGLEVHHVDGYKNNDLDFLKTLCYLCHGIAPMGQEAFGQWMLLGESGIEALERRLSLRGIKKLSREAILGLCSVLVEIGIETNKLKLKTARERMRNSGIKCEGRHKFGHFPREAETLEKIIRLRSSGITCDQIAEALNMNGVPTRMGRPWRGAMVNKLLKRELKIPPKQKIVREPKPPKRTDLWKLPFDLDAPF